ncbi:MAG: transketolase [Alphaproteobacteria bacterium]|nr:transketolase [Alphaproteobacteria bacterium]
MAAGAAARRAQGEDASTANVGPADSARADRLRILRALERKVLWLSAWTIHNANHLRPSRDGLKVGGHQASTASLVTVITALFLDALRPQDRVAVKPHASPAMHALLYLLGREKRETLERFRSVGGAQSYPSRTKDGADIDFSTGSVGLGVAMTSFASLARDYLALKDMLPKLDRAPRMIALMGDAELDEGNVFEAMLEGWKHDVRNLWWVIDYNRQSLDSVVSDRLYTRFDGLFNSMGWNVVTLKYGKRLESAFARPGGSALRDWIDACPNSLYSALCFKGGAAWREHLTADIGGKPGVRDLVGSHDDATLHALMTNLAGHDMESVLEAYAAATGDAPTCFIAYTIKGFGLPFAGHKDNHAGLMNAEQMATFQASNRVPAGQEWERFAGLDVPAEELQSFLDGVPWMRGIESLPRPEGAGVDGRQYVAPAVPVPATLPGAEALTGKLSTQEAFGRLLSETGRVGGPLADRLVTTSPDVAVSTNLGPWVNRRGVFDRRTAEDVFKQEKVVSAQRWSQSPQGQHIELGIAEHNLFIMLAALGLTAPLFGKRLIPVGTLYDPFVKRGLDALNYALYQDARFMLVATPSGITLAPEGGAHQSVITPLIGMGLSGLTYYEPAFADELATIMAWGFGHMQAEDGGSLYLRLSTRSLDQPSAEPSRARPDWADSVIAGGYWQVQPAPGADLAVAYVGAVSPEARAAVEMLREDQPGIGLLAITSPDRLHRDWRLSAGGNSHIARLLAPLAPDAALVTVMDGHPATLSWLGAVAGHRIRPLGVDHFGQSADLPDLYRLHGIDADAIVDAAASALVERARRASA